MSESEDLLPEDSISDSTASRTGPSESTAAAGPPALPPLFQGNASPGIRSSLEMEGQLTAAMQTISSLQRSLFTLSEERRQQERRRQRKKSIWLFLLTFLSTFLVGSQYIPLEYMLGNLIPRYGGFLNLLTGGKLQELGEQSIIQGLSYAVPVMGILLFHEMGHYLQALRYRVPASLPYFIPMPLPPLGTMGAVIFQGQGSATRRQMFDIAVSGPLAGLAVILPVLWYGLKNSGYQALNQVSGLEFGDPLLLTWMIEYLHGPEPAGHIFALNQVAFAGWVGVLITSLNLLPVGQLDGGHILYTLIGRKAHWVARAVVATAVAGMLITDNYSFLLLLILMLLTGIRHPPTADDSEPLGAVRHVIGWLTLAFLIIGFTPNPISVSTADQRSQAEDVQPDDPLPLPPASITDGLI